MKSLPTNLVEVKSSLSTFTPNYNLEKPSQDDFYDIDVHNKNYDILDDVIKEIEKAVGQALQSGADVKEAIKNAINSKTTVPDVTINDPWSLYIQRIEEIKEGRGNAQQNDVLQNKTFTNDSGQLLTGTMPNRGNKRVVLTNKTERLPSGYYSGIEVVWDNNIRPENIVEGIDIYDVRGEYIAPTPTRKKVDLDISDITFKNVNINNVNSWQWFEVASITIPNYNPDWKVLDLYYYLNDSIRIENANIRYEDGTTHTNNYIYIPSSSGKYQKLVPVCITKPDYTFFTPNADDFVFEYVLNPSSISLNLEIATSKLTLEVRPTFDKTTGVLKIEARTGATLPATKDPYGRIELVSGTLKLTNFDFGSGRENYLLLSYLE